MKRPWSPEDTSTLKRMAGAGNSDQEIADHLKREVKLIGKKRRDMGIDRGISPALLRMLRRVNAKRTVARNEMTMRQRDDIPKVAQERDNGRC